ncbi:cobalamin biosynthesis protein [Sansalvadorimonas verongulae]|uniref:cobalamin biosynthesis protein n=1 Tax=Sansalvadorimonas verongulae TaxID=2172824 RepID=UPI0012BD01BA|nr:cobalamin biosynthesis protein [Sansalvadorimonas verongulae]MTI14888.1 cobalamin biosynthesis protein [Sansalvadorimonas verongulae]
MSDNGCTNNRFAGSVKAAYVVGIGSERGTPLEVIGQGVMQYLDQLDIDIQDVLVASLEIKQYDPAYGRFAQVHDVPFVTCDAVTLSAVSGCSDPSIPWFDPKSISERSALFFSGAQQLLAPSFSFRLCLGERGVVVSVCKVLRAQVQDRERSEPYLDF